MEGRANASLIATKTLEKVGPDLGRNGHCMNGRNVNMYGPRLCMLTTHLLERMEEVIKLSKCA